MKVYDILEVVGIEAFSSDPTPAFRGRLYLNTVSGLLRYYTPGGAWADVGAAGGSSSVTGTRGAPTLISAAGGVVSLGTPTTSEFQFIAGNGGAQVVSANPQISAGYKVGQLLTLAGTDNTNTVQLSDGTGLDLNGAWLGDAHSVIELVWDGTNWLEVTRR